MSKLRHIEQTHNSLIFSGLDANPLCSISLETHIFNILNTITMKNQVTMTNQERQEFNDWREDNCIGFRTQCTQYRFDFKSIQGLEDYYIKEYMSDVIEFNGIRFDSISAMEDYIEANDVMEFIDIVSENLAQGKLS
jgi:hypothetical protein